MPFFSLNDKTALITGGARGIGEAIVRRFAAAGADVHLLDVNAEAATALVAELTGAAQQVTFHPCDISDHTETIRVVDAIAEDASIDILINNAGIAHIGTVEQTTEADLDRLYQVNIKGVYNGLFAVIPHMKRSGGGCILNMASVASVVAVAERFAYSMTKGAVLTMTYAVAKDYLAHNIRCNSIAPARIHTPFVDGYLAQHYPGREDEMYDRLAQTQPIGRMGTPEEVAALAQYLCSDEAAFITGTNYPIDGGFITLHG
ncbi:MAG TPA: SDR family oxidoreductase [Rhodothermales bacterium]|nr:SDR family oxidoreductase [Rhodothermales bacterium]